jgi:hypothetical protein
MNMLWFEMHTRQHQHCTYTSTAHTVYLVIHLQAVSVVREVVCQWANYRCACRGGCSVQRIYILPLLLTKAHGAGDGVPVRLLEVPNLVVPTRVATITADCW